MSKILSLRPKKELQERIRKIAKENGLSISDVANMCLAGGIPMVELKMDEIHRPARKKVA